MSTSGLFEAGVSDVDLKVQQEAGSPASSPVAEEEAPLGTLQEEARRRLEWMKKQHSKLLECPKLQKHSNLLHGLEQQMVQIGRFAGTEKAGSMGSVESSEVDDA